MADEKMFNLEVYLAIGTLIAKYGVPAALKILAAWKMDKEPTQENINDLKAMVPKPETYFED